MRYSAEPKFRKYVKGYGFLSFARTIGDEYGKKLTDTVTKTGIDAAKSTLKRVVQKTAETTEDLIWHKIVDTTTSLGKAKNKEKEKEKEEERQEIYVPPEKIQQIIDGLTLFWHCIKREYQKITNVLSATPDEVPRFITKNG